MASPSRRSLGEPGSGCQSGSEVFHISPEGRELGDLIVELTRRVRLMCLPIDPRQPRLARLFIDMLDQRPAHPHPTGVRGCEQVLQVANVLDHRRVAVMEVMDQPHELSVALRDCREHWFISIQKPSPGHFGDLARKLWPLIEEIVPVPQRLPLLAVLRPYWSDDHALDLSEIAQQIREPRHGRVEPLAASDPFELNRPQLTAALLVLA